MELKFTKEDLKRMQALPLYRKIMISQTRIVEWYLKNQGKVYVSYSGGKDSSVLLDLVRRAYPEVPAVYVDTRLDYPEVREHVKNTENVIFLKPDMNFRQVIDTYGFCFPSKDVAQSIEAARRNVPYASNFFDGKLKDGTDKLFYDKFKKWKWLVDTDLKISAKCCAIMKEKPLIKFQKDTGLNPYIGILASESRRRLLSWYRHGCNAFDIKFPKSKPLSFWTEQDVLRYIIDYDVKIPSVYGSILMNKKGKLKCTGEQRTGCVYCPIGSHLDKVNKFQRLKLSHPELYKFCMEQLGLDEFLTAVKVPH